MAESLFRCAPQARLFVLAFDPAVGAEFAGLFDERVEVVSIDHLEAVDDQLREVRSDRTFREYLSTVRAPFMLELFRSHPELQDLTFVDADMYFFSSPEPLLDELKSAHVLLTPHEFPVHCEHWRRCGDYNAGWFTVRNSEPGIAALEWWRRKCLEWCKLVVDGERFANQGYLNQMSEMEQVQVVRHPGVNVGPWSATTRALSLQSSTYLVGGLPLISYHFSTLKRMGLGLYLCNLRRYGGFPRGVLAKIYLEYVKRFESLHRHRTDLGLAGPEWPASFQGRLYWLYLTLIKLLRSDFIWLPPWKKLT